MNRELTQFEFKAMMEGVYYIYDTLFKNSTSFNRTIQQALHEVIRLRGCPQNPKYHSKGDAFLHTLSVVHRALKLSAKPELFWAAMFHDTGKSYTIDVNEKGDITYYGYDKESVRCWKEFCKENNVSKDLAEKVEWLIANHMRVEFKQRPLIDHELFPLLVKLLEADPWGQELERKKL